MTTVHPEKREARQSLRPGPRSTKPLPTRLTVQSAEELERHLWSLLRQIARVCCAAPLPVRVRAVVLHGGYGRGEGGVEWVDGVARPHNNLDILVVTDGRAPEMQALLRRRVRDLAERYGIGIDVGVVPHSTLLSSEQLVMWHDLYRGHVVLAGDENVIRGLRHLADRTIAPWDVRNLLANRATLFLLARELLQNASRPVDTRSVIKHIMKGIIGVGDAALYFEGHYDSSYLNRRRAMAGLSSVSPWFREQYDRAIGFRIAPEYAVVARRQPDLPAWLMEVVHESSRIHLRLERQRMRAPELRWSLYHEKALSHGLFDAPLRPRAVARGLRGLSSALPWSASLSITANLGARWMGDRNRLAVLLPAVLYPAGPEAREQARVLLRARSAEPHDLFHAYLQAWGQHGDPNFGPIRTQLGIGQSPAWSPT